MKRGGNGAGAQKTPSASSRLNSSTRAMCCASAACRQARNTSCISFCSLVWSGLLSARTTPLPARSGMDQRRNEDRRVPDRRPDKSDVLGVPAEELAVGIGGVAATTEPGLGTAGDPRGIGGTDWPGPGTCGALPGVEGSISLYAAKALRTGCIASARCWRSGGRGWVPGLCCAGLSNSTSVASGAGGGTASTPGDTASAPGGTCGTVCSCAGLASAVAVTGVGTALPAEGTPVGTRDSCAGLSWPVWCGTVAGVNGPPTRGSRCV